MLIKQFFFTSLTVLSVQPKAPLYWWAGGQTGFLMNSSLILFPKFIFSCFIPFQHRGDLTVFEIWRACWIMSGVSLPDSVPLFHFRFHASSASTSCAFTPTEHSSIGIFYCLLDLSLPGCPGVTPFQSNTYVASGKTKVIVCFSRQ